MATTSQKLPPFGLSLRGKTTGRQPTPCGLKHGASGELTLVSTDGAGHQQFEDQTGIQMSTAPPPPPPLTTFDAWIANDLSACLDSPDTNLTRSTPSLIDGSDGRGGLLMAEDLSMDQLLEQALKEVERFKQAQPDAAALSPIDLGLAWLGDDSVGQTISPQLTTRSMAGSTTSAGRGPIDFSPFGLVSPDMVLASGLPAAPSPEASRTPSIRSSKDRWSPIPYDAPTLPRKGYADKRREKRQRSLESGVGAQSVKGKVRGARAESTSTNTVTHSDDDGEGVTKADGEGDGDEPATVAIKRRQNTLAARRSRMRKAHEVEDLRARIEVLESENRALRARIEQGGV